MRTKLSVLMGVYNTPIKYLKDAIASILEQTYSDIEFVIVDDCSTDDSVVGYLRQVEREDSRIRLIQNQTNLGLTKSLNVGLGICRGKYVARMDSDDISLPNRLLKQVQYLEEHRDVVLVGSNKIVFGDGIAEEDGALVLNRCDDLEIYMIRSLIQHSGPAHPSFMYRKSFLDDNGIRYREDILKAQDYGIIADILKAGGKISKINESLIKYRIHLGQISAVSEIEQKSYQSRVSFDYISQLFPELSEAECAAISLLGNDYDVETIIEAVENNSQLSKTCMHISRNADELRKSVTYVCALRKIVGLNKEKHIFNESKFETELRCEWWRKYLERLKSKRQIWGISAYTLMCRNHAIKVRKGF